MSTHRPLDRLECQTVALLDFGESLGRPFTPRECRTFRFLLIGWERPRIKAAFRAMPKTKLAYYTDLMQKLRELIEPDFPDRFGVAHVRLHREKREVVAEMNGGNFSTKSPPFKGVSVRRLTAGEATERTVLMTQLAQGIAAIARELALVRNRDRPEAARMVRLGKLMAKLAKQFAARPNAIPAEPSLEEIMEQMRQLNDLMGAPPK